MTEGILSLMQNLQYFAYGREWKICNYNELNQEIRKKTKLAKEKWLQEQCNEMEAYEKKYDSFNVHRKVKEIDGVKS